MRNGLTLVRRVVCCKTPVIFRFRQMWWKGVIQNSLTRLNSLSRLRKVILLILILLGLLYYLGPSLFNIRRPSFHSDDLQQCIEDKESNYVKLTQNFDAFVNSPGNTGKRRYPLYVGNGKIAASLSGSGGLFVRLNRALSLPVKFYPVISTTAKDSRVRETSVLDIRSGIAHKIQAVKSSAWRKSCNYVENQLYAHRSRPSVLVQDIKITNNERKDLVVELDQIGASGWKGAITASNSFGDATGKKVEYTTTHGLVETPDPKYHVYVAVAMLIEKSTILVPSKQTKLIHVITVVNYTQPMLVKDGTVSAKLLHGVEEELRNVMKINNAELKAEHTSVWGKLWQSGFGISYSKASDALNGDKINSTMYYVLSNVPAPMYDLTTTKEQRAKIQQVLHYPDRCYSGHSTLQAMTLWIDAADEIDIARVTTTWMITLEKQNCDVMVQSGAEGVLQAMILSLGALRFGNYHLEFTMEPKDLHRDLYFHRINYGNNTHLNISVIVGDDNKASLYVALDRNDRPYYACDAGCIDKPMQLRKELTQLPVKLTKPVTAILYITADKLHMEELKHAIHVQEINEAPAHEHHVLALHRHGHHFGGLPTMFWVSIAFLVAIFHMFLCKLIYNEYCQGQDRFTGRGRYNV